MATYLVCPRCKKRFKAPSDRPAAAGKCSSCGTKLVLLAPEPPPIPAPAPRAAAAWADAVDPGEAEAVPLIPATKKPMFEDLVDMTAMVDIVFFLLIFFMVTSMQGIYASIGMPSPDQQKAKVSQGRRTVTEFERDTEYVIVRIDRDNTVWLDGAEVPSEQDLRVKLRATHHGAGSPNKMLVLGSSEARHGTVVMVLDAGNDAGMDEVQLAVDDES